MRERRATFAATPEQNALRPGTVTRWKNLVLAGDWTDTDLPSTIEGSIRSGDKAHFHYPESYHQLLFDLDAPRVLADAAAWIEARLPKDTSP